MQIQPAGLNLLQIGWWAGLRRYTPHLQTYLPARS